MANTHIDIFELKSPADLFRKVEADLAATEASDHDSWKAFDFYVTAEHLPDWLGLRDLVLRHSILRIVSHIANGAKHFSTNRHNAITRTEKSRYVEEGYAESDYVEEPLLTHLSTDEANELGVSVIDAVTSVARWWTSGDCTFPDQARYRGVNGGECGQAYSL